MLLQLHKILKYWLKQIRIIVLSQIITMTKGPIIIVEDDPDDQEIYAESIQAIGVTNKLHFFNGSEEALQYLSTTTEQPFIILSDINMPRMNGLQFKEKIQQDNYLKEKGIPFIFISTNVSAPAVKKAHVLSVQGYFQKPNTIEETKNMLKKAFRLLGPV